MESEKPRFITKPVSLRFVAAFLFVMLALASTSLIRLLVERPISSVLFLVAIMASSWLCGFRAGIFATIISGFLLDYFFVTPLYEFNGSRDEIVRLIVFVVEGALISWLFDSQRIAIDELRHSRGQLQALTNHLQTVRESEQKRIALEIHDNLGQALTGLKMEVHWLNRQIDEKGQDLSNGVISEKLHELLATIDTTVSSVRRIATELRPSILDDFGLIAAMEWQMQEFERMTGIPCSFSCDTADPGLDSEANTAIFRIFQETLTNVMRHACASTVSVDLRNANPQIILRVADDGIGIKLEELKNKRSLGILGMKERAKLIGGSIEILPGDAGGTEIVFKLPISAKLETARAA